MNLKLVATSLIIVSVILIGLSIHNFRLQHGAAAESNEQIVRELDELKGELKANISIDQSLEDTEKNLHSVARRISRIEPQLNQAIKAVKNASQSKTCGPLQTCQIQWPKEQTVFAIESALDDFQRVKQDIQQLNLEVSSLQMSRIDVNRRITDIEQRFESIRKTVNSSSMATSPSILLSSFGSIISTLLALTTIWIGWSTESRDKLKFEEEITFLRLTNASLNKQLRADAENDSAPLN